MLTWSHFACAEDETPWIPKDAEGNELPTDFEADKLTVAELSDELKKRNLTVKGWQPLKGKKPLVDTLQVSCESIHDVASVHHILDEDTLRI